LVCFDGCERVTEVTSQLSGDEIERRIVERDDTHTLVQRQAHQTHVD
jgi:hypothetical protein